MANIFKLTTDYKQIVDMADELDEQTLDDMIEALGDATAEKIASLIAVKKSVDKEMELAKEYKKDIEARIKTMENTAKRINDYILLGVDTVGQPKKGAEQFRKLTIEGHPWVKSVWTQYNPPKVEIVDERTIDHEFLVPQPDKVDTKAIAKVWKEKTEEYEAKRSVYLLELQTMLDEDQIDEMEADERLEVWEKENRHNYQIAGVDVTQSVGVRYR